MAKRKLSSILRELDEASKTLTGRDIPSWGKQAWEALRRPKVKDAPVAEPAADDPYEILSLDPNCIPADIISRYRELAHKYHPDNLETGDVEKFKRFTRAYEQICSTRGMK